MKNQIYLLYIFIALFIEEEKNYLYDLFEYQYRGAVVKQCISKLYENESLPLYGINYFRTAKTDRHKIF